MLRDALEDARALGYTIAGFSGGEPLLYPFLAEALSFAHEMGLQTSVTTNGMLLTRSKIDELRGNADLIAISLDGKPETHNRIRANGRAFEHMARRIEDLRESGIAFGFIFTLTMENVHELEWVAEFAATSGATLLQVHPLEETGRARTAMKGSEPDHVEAAAAYLECLKVVVRHGHRMHVHLDIAHKGVLAEQPERVFADDRTGAIDCSFADLVNPLVLRSDGAVVPLQHNFPRKFALGNLARDRLLDLANRWRERRHSQFQEACRATWREVTAEDAVPLVNWYRAVQHSAKRL
jgi:MoaA/NifB/PqqE/SkfB family radical SAM enzyme